jgi:hypothetical protein
MFLLSFSSKNNSVTPDTPPDVEIDINDVLANPEEYSVVINGAVAVIKDVHGNPTGEEDYSGTYDNCHHHRAGIDEPEVEGPDGDYIVWSRTDYIMPWFIHDPDEIYYGTDGHNWCIYYSGEIMWYCDDEIPGPGSTWIWVYDGVPVVDTNVNIEFIKK